jgi:transcriptional regulator with XRE-family HTH domain
MKELNRKEVAARLKMLRKSSKLTIEKLAEMVDVSIGFIAQVEKGDSGVSLENMYKLCQIFDVSMDFIVSGRESVGNNAPSYMAVTSALYGLTDKDIAFAGELARFLRDRVTVKE